MLSATSLHHSKHNPQKTRGIAKREGVAVAPAPIVFKTIPVKIANRLFQKRSLPPPQSKFLLSIFNSSMLGI